MLGTEGVTVTFAEDGIEALARIAAEVNEAVENIGARRLQTVMEKLLEDVSFEAEDRRGETLVVDAAFVAAAAVEHRQKRRSQPLRAIGPSSAAKAAGRGTIHRRANGGGVRGAWVSDPPTVSAARCHLPTSYARREELIFRYRQTRPGTNGGHTLAFTPASRSRSATQLLHVRTALALPVAW